MRVPPAILWDSATLSLKLLDQRLLPHEQTYLDITNLQEACAAIATLAVRGAPAIGIAAAYALVVCARSLPEQTATTDLTDLASQLKAARPTAVNLAWAVDRLLKVHQAGGGLDALHREARAIHDEDRAICRAIGAAGAPLIKPGVSVLTHCNAGALAVSELGTATAPLYLSHQAGIPFRVYADETRPLLQGARLTAWELQAAGIDVTLICDNAAAALMASGEIDLVIVGTDRVTRNGDVVNKIGTLNLAVLCRHFGIPFYVACPSSTFDPHTATGADVTIEHRAAQEVLGEQAARVKAHNPAFDVTPAELVSGLITDRGLLDYSSDHPLLPLLEDQQQY
jgi:methylthioribose-1-phosphate isomerase